MSEEIDPNPIAIALHGGSGTIMPERLGSELESEYREALQEALDEGWQLLSNGSSALAAVESAARVLEDCPLFNAGKGSVFTANETHELDAAIMCGATKRAGAVAAVRTVRNPVSLARKVLVDGRYVFLAGNGAESFADEQSLERVTNEWFSTHERREQLLSAQESEGMLMDHDGKLSTKFGTIGVVALDKRGDLAAATSTGGLTNKRFGRVGDSPLIGAGTYADNATCAVSCTGYGEEFIRSVVAHDVASRMEYLQEDVATAAKKVIFDRLKKVGGLGGLVAVDRAGNVSLPFNTDGMYRAWRSSSGSEGVAIFK
ncbi:MAG: isoaspartyl peptidase/L-asparaginase [Symploca sp. SIO2D2]|nr:isoaspartyl peptidase/L-asparaginase [Symploca sp. SIO2D2]